MQQNRYRGNRNNSNDDNNNHCDIVPVVPEWHRLLSQVVAHFNEVVQQIIVHLNPNCFKSFGLDSVISPSLSTNSTAAVSFDSSDVCHHTQQLVSCLRDLRRQNDLLFDECEQNMPQWSRCRADNRKFWDMNLIEIRAQRFRPQSVDWVHLETLMSRPELQQQISTRVSYNLFASGSKVLKKLLSVFTQFWADTEYQMKQMHESMLQMGRVAPEILVEKVSMEESARSLAIHKECAAGLVQSLNVFRSHERNMLHPLVKLRRRAQVLWFEQQSPAIQNMMEALRVASENLFAKKEPQDADSKSEEQDEYESMLQNLENLFRQFRSLQERAKWLDSSPTHENPKTDEMGRHHPQNHVNHINTSNVEGSHDQVSAQADIAHFMRQWLLLTNQVFAFTSQLASDLHEDKFNTVRLQQHQNHMNNLPANSQYAQFRIAINQIGKALQQRIGPLSNEYEGLRALHNQIFKHLASQKQLNADITGRPKFFESVVLSQVTHPNVQHLVDNFDIIQSLEKRATQIQNHLDRQIIPNLARASVQSKVWNGESSAADKSIPHTSSLVADYVNRIPRDTAQWSELVAEEAALIQKIRQDRLAFDSQFAHRIDVCRRQCHSEWYTIQNALIQGVNHAQASMVNLVNQTVDRLYQERKQNQEQVNPLFIVLSQIQRNLADQTNPVASNMSSTLLSARVQFEDLVDQTEKFHQQWINACLLHSNQAMLNSIHSALTHIAKAEHNPMQLARLFDHHCQSNCLLQHTRAK